MSNATNSATEGSQIVAAIVEALRAQGPLRTIDQALGALDKLGIRYDIHISSSTTQQTTQQTPKGRRESFEEPNSLPYPSPTGFGVKSGTVKPLPNGPGYVPDLGGDEDDDEVVLDDDEDDAYNVAPKAEIYRAQLPRQNQRQGAQFNPNRSKQPAGRGRRSSDSFKPNFKQNMNNHPNPNLNNKRPFSGPTKNGKRPYFSG